MVSPFWSIKVIIHHYNNNHKYLLKKIVKIKNNKIRCKIKCVKRCKIQVFFCVVVNIHSNIKIFWESWKWNVWNFHQAYRDNNYNKSETHSYEYNKCPNIRNIHNIHTRTSTFKIKFKSKIIIYFATYAIVWL